MGRHHTFPLPDRTGQRVIHQRTGREGVIVGKGTCAYYVQMGDAVEVRSAYELGYPDEPAAAPQRTIGAKGARYEQLDLFG